MVASFFRVDASLVESLHRTDQPVAYDVPAGYLGLVRSCLHTGLHNYTIHLAAYDFRVGLTVIYSDDLLQRDETWSKW